MTPDKPPGFGSQHLKGEDIKECLQEVRAHPHGFVTCRSPANFPSEKNTVGARGVAKLRLDEGDH